MDFDTAKPHPARVYDWMIGGSENFPADREAARRILELNPDSRRSFVENRRFLGRVVRHLVDQGVRQFLDIGAGLPAGGNVHEIAHAVAPDTRVVYVDHDEIVLAHARALMARSDRVRIVGGDATRPQEILDAPVVRDFIDWSQPVGLLMVALLHFVSDADDPARIVTTFRDALPAGSFLAISHGGVEGWEDRKEQIRKASQAYVRTRDEIAGLFAGFELLEPGLVDVAWWRPTDPGSGPAPTGLYGGVGRLAIGA
ncbi:SAM-dependent methyltransferase [Streptosporangium sp. NBC_01639]|uniref:SAM-dependent methyltransferase n=1 Tax=Streptosporangium sp. NBC_01639 TaxID=2975948 RepID=UPI00386FA26C|nr:SAM-dependent methyltransferase [Streptosporangium sp. NBC_01639]